ncbi:Glycosyl hydrolases family 16 [Sphingomonas gellani]|uniref:Glycosyl hydrolases family 16 n=1 Tax=Sphingomonas gellani TaxID=1166340 RepID=A0A1H8AN38_9SPHN|nr:glycoside hydrolase family 16 protein [Sphingomonas gellani]SEM71936.1 Glycosyl hydrolases family 16 [Sphingomonas gellani]
MSGALALLALLQLGASDHRINEAMRRPADARLVWSDEFSGPRLDPKKWRYDAERNKDGWYNHEQQYYAVDRPQNLRLENGRLVIEARHERLPGAADWGGQTYTSAKIMTLGPASWTYGFYEVRAKLPCTRGTWPAIWMLPDSGKWPDGGEIDIMEHVGSQPQVVHATLHTALFTHSKGTQRGASLALPSSCSAFHRYQLDWQPDAITIGVDDHAYMRVRNDQPGGRGAWPFDRPFHMILNLAVGGDWAGSKGIDDAALPQRFEVDYVRVWQRAVVSKAPR